MGAKALEGGGVGVKEDLVQGRSQLIDCCQHRCRQKKKKNMEHNSIGRGKQVAFHSETVGGSKLGGLLHGRQLL